MTCVHWWLIAPPTGPESLGRCRKCGKERMFKNATDVATKGELVQRDIVLTGPSEPYYVYGRQG